MNQANPSRWNEEGYAVITNIEEPVGFKINWRGSIEDLIQLIRQLDAGTMLLILPDVPQEAPPDFAKRIGYKYSIIGWWSSARKAYVKTYSKRRRKVIEGSTVELVDMSKVKEGSQYFPPNWPRHRI